MPQLRATLPISIFISPNIPLDEEGNIVSYDPANPLLPAPDTGSHIAPPGYGEHILDQLYDDIDISHLQTPAVRSGATTPYLGHSRTVSAENLPTASSQQQQAGGITAAALRSRLADLPPADSRRNTMYSVTTPSICITESPASGSSSSSSSSSPSSPADAALEPALTRTSSAGTGASSRTSSSSSASDSVGPRTPPAAVMPEIQALSRVPSYATAVKTPARPLSYAGPSGSGSIPDELLPDYLSAVMMAPGGEAAAARPATAAATPAPAAEGGSAGRRSSMLLSLPSLGRTPSSQADTRRPGLRSRLGITNGTSGSGSAGRRASTLGFSMLHARLGERVM